MKLLYALTAALMLLTGCGDSTYTLYRDSPVATNDSSLKRVHVASFDAYKDESYNQKNCKTAAGLFQAQPGISVRYWCEKGSFKK